MSFRAYVPRTVTVYGLRYRVGLRRVYVEDARGTYRRADRHTVQDPRPDRRRAPINALTLLLEVQEAEVGSEGASRDEQAT